MQKVSEKREKIDLWHIGFLFLFFVLLFPIRIISQEVIPSCSSSEILSALNGRSQLNVALPGVTESYKCTSGDAGRIKTIHVLQAEPGQELATFLRGFYVYFVWIVGILAVIMTMYGGLKWLTAAGNASRIESAKSTMNGALIGLVLTLTSYVVLQAINPNLVTLRVPFVEPVKNDPLSISLCTTEQQVGADSRNILCGEVYEYEDPISKAEQVCYSSKCTAGRTCLPCEGKAEPYTFCLEPGYTCGFLESLIGLNVTLDNVAVEHELSTFYFLWSDPYQKDPSYFAYNGDNSWVYLDESNRGPFSEGQRLSYISSEAIPLTAFGFGVEFKINVFGGKKYCRATFDDTEANQAIFTLPYAPGARVNKDFVIDVKEIHDACFN